MKKKKQKTRITKQAFGFLLPIFVMALSLSSCEKENLQNNDKFVNSPTTNEIFEPTILDAGVITNEDGILVFENEEKMDVALEVLSGMPDAERQSWERQHGFTSLRTQYEIVMQAEYDKLIAPFLNMPESDVENLPFPGHSQEYNDAIKSKLILEFVDTDGDSSYELRHKAGYMAYITNSEGFALAGKKLYLIQNDKIKTKEDASIKDFSTLIKQTTSNESEKIKVITVGSYTKGIANFNSNSGWNYVNNNKNKGLLEVYFQMDYVNNKFMILKNTQFHSVAKRKSWGKWINNPGTHEYFWNANSFFSIYNYNYSQYAFYYFSAPGLTYGNAIPPNTNSGHHYVKYASGGDSWKTIASNWYFSPPVFNGEQWNFDHNNHYIKYHCSAGIPGGYNGIGCVSKYNWVP